MSNVPERFSLLGILRGLMVSDHLGDVADEINYLHDILGIPRPEGGFHEGWTDQDWLNIQSPKGAEMSEKGATTKCPVCNRTVLVEDMIYGEPDPLRWELYNDKTPVDQCKDCAHQSAMDI